MLSLYWGDEAGTKSLKYPWGATMALSMVLRLAHQRQGYQWDLWVPMHVCLGRGIKSEQGTSVSDIYQWCVVGTLKLQSLPSWMTLHLGQCL